MTRINCIPVEELHDKHLIAEYRELPRVFNLARVGVKIPDQYCLGTGHVTFFYDKILYLVTRYNQLIDEMELRGFNYNEAMVNSLLSKAQSLPRSLLNNWVPTDEAMDLNRSRINQRLREMSL